MVILMATVLAFVIAIFFSLDKAKQYSATNVSIQEKGPEPVKREPPLPEFPPAFGIDRQYQNTHVSMTDRHPVLAYQMAHNKGIVPATLGDPIRPPDIAGPIGMYGDRRDALLIRPRARPYSAAPGPYPGEPIGVPVPANALKMSAYTDYGSAMMPGNFFPYQGGSLGSDDFSRPFGGIPPGAPAFVGSVDAFAPFPGVNTPWEKAGIITSSARKNEILNLYRRAIAPGQDLWEYQVQDKNGFIIKLDQTRYLEDGDEIREVIGKHGLGPWRVHMFVQNRYVWV